MKLLVAGGREYRFTDEDREWLDRLHEEHRFDELVNGGARGADACAVEWAESVGVPVRLFLAKWAKHGRAAGPIRNREMAEYLSASVESMVVLFPGGRGTADMRRVAEEFGLKVVQRASGGA